MTTHASKETVAARLAQLPYLPMENIWALWDQYFDRRPGHHHRTWLESRLAYKIQDDGRFEYQARAYKSLSGVAKAITGTAWSGPAFFGLRQPAPKRQGALA